MLLLEYREFKQWSSMSMLLSAIICPLISSRFVQRLQPGELREALLHSPVLITRAHQQPPQGPLAPVADPRKLPLDG